MRRMVLELVKVNIYVHDASLLVSYSVSISLVFSYSGTGIKLRVVHCRVVCVQQVWV